MFQKEIYAERRKELCANMKSGVILLFGSVPSKIDNFANDYPFRQNSNFLYYTGIKAPDVTLLIDIDNNREVMYADDFSIEDQVWTGPVKPFADLAKEAGVNAVKKTSDLENEVKSILNDGRKIYYVPVCRAAAIIKISSLLNLNVGEVNNSASEKLVDFIIKQREIKADCEVSEIEKAVNVSFDIYSMMLKKIQSGLIERELLAEINFLLNCKGLHYSFPTILTKNGQYLHNLNDDNILEDGDLLLVDSGVVGDNGYSSDITRTFPVSGKFTDKQKEIYNIVLEANLKAIETIRPGITFRDVHLEACKIIAGGLKACGIMKGDVEAAVKEGAHALFMPHGLGHAQGMDTHDMEVFGEDKVGYDETIKRSNLFGLSALRFGKELKSGYVLTVEPGIYFIPGLIKKWKLENKFSEYINYEKLEEYLDFGGIRIEDDILVTDTGSKVLGKRIPKTVDEIESLMA